MKSLMWSLLQPGLAQRFMCLPESDFYKLCHEPLHTAWVISDSFSPLICFALFQTELELLGKPVCVPRVFIRCEVVAGDERMERNNHSIFSVIPVVCLAIVAFHVDFNHLKKLLPRWSISSPTRQSALTPDSSRRLRMLSFDYLLPQASSLGLEVCCGYNFLLLSSHSLSVLSELWIFWVLISLY